MFFKFNTLEVSKQVTIQPARLQEIDGAKTTATMKNIEILFIRNVLNTSIHRSYSTRIQRKMIACYIFGAFSTSYRIQT